MAGKCLDGHHWEGDYMVPDDVKFGTYYVRNAASLDNVLPFLKGRQLAVQAGGHLGAYPRKLATIFSNVITFERNPKCITALLANLEHRGVRVIHAALGIDPSDARIDDLRVKPDLICLDLDGGEPAALRGAAETVDRYHPVVVMEETTMPRGSPASFAVYREACDWLYKRGYTLVAPTRCGNDRIWVKE